MPESRSKHFLGPLKRPLKLIAGPFPTADELTPDHPYSRAFGFERARQLLDPGLLPHRQKATERRAKVLKMSKAGRPVAEIAKAVGLRPDYVVKVRARLRREGLLQLALKNGRE